jgi:membrane protein YqaA with SNARE-associated domain
MPIIGDPLCLAAGWSGVKVIPAAFFIGLGKALRYGALVGAFNSLG